MQDVNIVDREDRTMLISFSYALLPDQIVMPGSIAKPMVRPRSRMVPPPAGVNATGVRWNSYNNTSLIEFFAHTGTHIDVPFHISPQAAALDAFGIDDFVFEKPLFIRVPKQELEQIEVDDLVLYRDRLVDADLLLLYTGFSQYRKTDPDKYNVQQPSVSPEAAQYLMEEYPSLRAVAVDLMGIENIAKGKVSNPPFPTHRAFLLHKPKFMLVEDANLEALDSIKAGIKRVFVIPLLLPGAEAMPVTAFAEIQ